MPFSTSRGMSCTTTASGAASRPTTSGPNRSTTAASPGVPGSTTSRATASASTTTAPRDASWADTVDLPEPIPPVRPTRSMSATLARGMWCSGVRVGEPGREAAGGDRPPAGRGDAQQRLALLDHRPAVLVPVGVLSRDAAEVLHEGLDGVGRVDDLALAVELHPRAPEVVGEHEHADPGVAAGVDGLGPPRVGRDDDAALRVDAAGDRRGLGAAVGAGRHQHHLVPWAGELEEAVEVDVSGRRDGACHAC